MWLCLKIYTYLSFSWEILYFLLIYEGEVDFSDKTPSPIFQIKDYDCVFLEQGDNHLMATHHKEAVNTLLGVLVYDVPVPVHVHNFILRANWRQHNKGISIDTR